MSQFEKEYFTMGVRVKDTGGKPADTELKVMISQSLISQSVSLSVNISINLSISQSINMSVSQ